MIEVRQATAGDLSALVALADSLVHEDAAQRDPFANLDWVRNDGAARYGEVLSNEDAACFIAVEDNRPIGYISGRWAPPSAFRRVAEANIGSLFVLADYRQRGVGERLIGAYIAWARARGAQAITVSAYASNDGALRFYARHGFSPKTVTLEYMIDEC